VCTLVEFLHDYQIALSLLAGAILWVANEWSKRHWQDLQRREEHYRALLTAVQGFYGGDVKGRGDFLDQLRICWLDCPDHVIRSANRFLLAVHEDSKASKEEKEAAIRDLALAMRNDLLPWYRTSKLASSDFQLLRIRK